MYRIRLATGEEAVYRTVQELAQAVASGMVSPTAEVYHKAANRWLPINTHPDYRAAMATGQQTAINPAIQVSGTPGKEAAPPEAPKPPSGKSPALTVNPVPAAPKLTPPKAPAVPPRQSTTKTAAVPTDLDFDLIDPVEEPAPSKAQTRQSVAIPVPPASPNTTKTTAIDLGPPPSAALPTEAEMIDLTAPEPPILNEAPPVPLLPEPPRPPRFRLDRNRLVLIASVAALVLAVGVTGLILVKSRPQTRGSDSTIVGSAALTPPESIAPPVDTTPPKPVAVTPKPAPKAAPVTPVRTARPGTPAETFPAPSRPVTPPVTPRRESTPKAAVVPPPAKPKPATGAKTPSYFQAYADARAEMDESLNYVSFRRVFAPGRFMSPDSLRATRRMVVAAGNILRVYRGREVMLEQQYRPDDPGGRNSLREPFETSEASRALLSNVDSLFALLVNQEGEVTVTEREIRFRSSSTARSYNDIRSQIAQTLATWRDSAEASNRVTMPRLVQALGNTLPPIAR